jgi:uncharacterized membrane protein (DUF373 family)
MNKHYRHFLSALRTAMIFVAGFLSYEILKIIAEEWDLSETDKIVKRKLYHFIIIFIFDLLILYSFESMFNIKL